MKNTDRCATRIAGAAFVTAFLLALEPPAAVAAPADLLAGAAVTFVLGAASATDAGRPALALEKPGDYIVTCRYAFAAAPPAGARFLTLEKHADVDAWRLNGAPIGAPGDGVRRRAFAGIPAGLLKPGTNVLEAVWRIHVGVGAGRAADGADERAAGVMFAAFPPVRIVPEKAEARAALQALSPADLAVRTGPILGGVRRDGFAVACRLNMPAAVTLVVDDRETASSPEGLDHLLRADGLAPGSEHAYELLAATPGAADPLRIGPFTARTLPDAGPWTFVAVGDSRSRPSDWAKVAEAIRRERPMLLIHTGDLVMDGRNDWEWDEQFWAPARDLLASVPICAVAGNHERRSPLLPALFPMRAGLWSDDWSQDFGPLLVVGIDTTLPGWKPGQERHRRLDSWLRRSRAPFVIAAGHYPPWSSGSHAKADAENLPVEPGMRTARVDVLPVLARHGAQAFVVGHDHDYERSEPPEGVTVIVAGGGGAPQREARPEAAVINPHSKIFVLELSYTLFTIDGDTLRVTARTPDGRDLDARSWPARTLAPETPAAPPLPAEAPPAIPELPAEP